MTDATTPARPPFKLVGPAAIKHLNVRKEGPEDDKILAVDVKLTFKQVDRRLCAFFDDALEDFLWRGETDALIVRNDFLNPVAYFNEVSGATVKIGMRDFFGCDVKKFSIQPADGGVITLTCSVSLYPSSGEVADLARLVQDEERVEIEGPPDLFAAPDGNSDPDSAAVAAVLEALSDIDPSLGLCGNVVVSMGGAGALEVLGGEGREGTHA